MNAIPFHVNCCSCQQTLTLQPWQRGAVVNCPGCGSSFVAHAAVSPTPPEFRPLPSHLKANRQQPTTAVAAQPTAVAAQPTAVVPQPPTVPPPPPAPTTTLAADHVINRSRGREVITRGNWFEIVFFLLMATFIIGGLLLFVVVRSANA